MGLDYPASCCKRSPYCVSTPSSLFRREAAEWVEWTTAKVGFWPKVDSMCGAVTEGHPPCCARACPTSPLGLTFCEAFIRCGDAKCRDGRKSNPPVDKWRILEIQKKARKFENSFLRWISFIINYDFFNEQLWFFIMKFMICYFAWKQFMFVFNAFLF